MCSEVAARGFLSLKGMGNSPQKALHRYPSGSSSCTTEEMFSLIGPFLQRYFLYFIFSFYFAVNAVPHTEQGCVPARRGAEAQTGKCQDTG